MLRRTGFTVLELLVALGLAAALLAVAIPRVSAALPGLLADQAARTLAADLRFARVQAVGENRRIRLVVELADGAWRIEADEEGVFAPRGGLRPLPSGVVFDPAASSRVAAGRVSITFQPRGHTFDNSTIALAAGEAARRIIVSGAGRVRIAP